MGDGGDGDWGLVNFIKLKHETSDNVLNFRSKIKIIRYDHCVQCFMDGRSNFVHGLNENIGNQVGPNIYILYILPGEPSCTLRGPTLPIIGIILLPHNHYHHLNIVLKRVT